MVLWLASASPLQNNKTPVKSKDFCYSPKINVATSMSVDINLGLLMFLKYTRNLAPLNTFSYRTNMMIYLAKSKFSKVISILKMYIFLLGFHLSKCTIKKFLMQNLSLWSGLLDCVCTLCYMIWDLSTLLSLPCMVSWIICCLCQIWLPVMQNCMKCEKTEFHFALKFLSVYIKSKMPFGTIKPKPSLLMTIFKTLIPILIHIFVHIFIFNSIALRTAKTP